MSLHEACYQGQLELVREHLQAGVDPNSPADASERAWISSAGPRPRPLNCVAIAWSLGWPHVEIARLLLAYGAKVDETVIRDHTAEMIGHEIDQAFRALMLGEVAGS